VFLYDGRYVGGLRPLLSRETSVEEASEVERVMTMEANTLLSDEQIDAALRDYQLGHDADAACHVPALCATVRHLKAENEKLMASRRVHELDNHHNALACGYCAGPLKDELERLKKLEALK
jgi:hypothetical protein